MFCTKQGHTKVAHCSTQGARFVAGGGRCFTRWVEKQSTTRDCHQSDLSIIGKVRMHDGVTS
jgi:hypothetical protein